MKARTALDEPHLFIGTSLIRKSTPSVRPGFPCSTWSGQPAHSIRGSVTRHSRFHEVNSRLQRVQEACLCALEITFLIDQARAVSCSLRKEASPLSSLSHSWDARHVFDSLRRASPFGKYPAVRFRSMSADPWNLSLPRAFTSNASLAFRCANRALHGSMLSCWRLV